MTCGAYPDPDDGMRIKITDSAGRVTRYDDGTYVTGIPFSTVLYSSRRVIIPFHYDDYSEDVIGGPEAGTYSIADVFVDDLVSFSGISLSVAPGEVHRYIINWTTLAVGGNGVTIQIDSDGDGAFEESFTSDAYLTSYEFEGRGTVEDDVDSDGIPDEVDNGPDTANPDQADLDEDGFGDVCDPDPGDPTIPFPVFTASVILQGSSRPEAGWEIPVRIQLFTPGSNPLSDTAIAAFTPTTSREGDLTICRINVPPGIYDVTIESDTTLINIVRSIDLLSGTNTVDMGTLLEGDANGDGIINISDFGILAVAFMSTPSDPNWDARADFDRNGIINISDFGLLAVNFMMASPVEVP